MPNWSQRRSEGVIWNVSADCSLLYVTLAYLLSTPLGWLAVSRLETVLTGYNQWICYASNPFRAQTRLRALKRIRGLAETQMRLSASKRV